MVWANLNYLISLALSFLLLKVFLVALYLSGSPIGTWRSAQKIRYLYGHHYMALQSYYDITVGGPPELIN